MSLIIGLDVGTTVVRAARRTEYGAAVPDGARIPAVACATDAGLVVGHDAVPLAAAHPERAVRAFLHLLGAVERPLTEPPEPRSARQAPTAKSVVSDLVAQAVAAAVPETAEGAEVRAVVAVRPSVPLRRRLALADAVRRAGVEVVRLVPATSCAAAATLADAPAGTFLVIDAGGGGLSVALVDTGSGVLDAHYAVSTDRVAGDGWDHAVAATIARWILTETGTDPAASPAPYARLLAAVRSANHDLVASGAAELRIPDYLRGLGGVGAPTGEALDLAIRLSTAVWEGPTAATAHQLRTLVNQALDAADWAVADLDGAILVGGAAALPVFADTLALDLGIAPLPARAPTDTVAAGAAVIGGVITGDVDNLLLLHGAAASFEFDDEAGRTTTVLQPQTGVPVRATAPVPVDGDYDGSPLTLRFRARTGWATDPEPVATAAVAPGPGDQVLAVTDVDANETSVLALAVEGEPVWSAVVSPHVLDAAVARPGGAGQGIVVVGADDDETEIRHLVETLAADGFEAATFGTDATDVDARMAAAACVVAVVTERGATSWRLAQRIGLAARLGRPVAGLQLVAARWPLVGMPTFTAQADGGLPADLVDWLRERPTGIMPGPAA